MSEARHRTHHRFSTPSSLTQPVDSRGPPVCNSRSRALIIFPPCAITSYPQEARVSDGLASGRRYLPTPRASVPHAELAKLCKKRGVSEPTNSTTMRRKCLRQYESLLEVAAAAQ